MTSSVNGGTLEHCHTNVFALTELNNLRWRCYFASGGPPPGSKLDCDPIIKAYGNCVQDNLVCAWRRQPPSLSPNFEPLTLPLFNPLVTKELWLFWFSPDEPPAIETHCAGLQNNDAEFGPGNATVCGVSYEVRTMFFKALHTFLMNSFARSGHIRFGRWFAKPMKQPLSGREHLLNEYILAYSFRLFVAGGNTVCMTLNLQRQPPIFKLCKRHLDLKRRIPVILGPWSLRGQLVGTDATQLRAQPSLEQQWEQWKQFWGVYQDEEVDEASKEDGVPVMVVVEVDGYRMLYPSCYIAVLLEDDPLRWPDPMNPESKTIDPVNELVAPNGCRRNLMHSNNVDGLRVLQMVLEGSFVGRKKNDPYTQNAPEDDDKWTFSDPSKPRVCACEECKLREQGLVSEKMRENGAEEEKNRAIFLENQEKINFYKDLEDVTDLGKLPPSPLQAYRQKERREREEKNKEMDRITKSQKPDRRRFPVYHRVQGEKLGVYTSSQSQNLPELEGEQANEENEDLDESSTDEEEQPFWCGTSKQAINTGIYCSTDDAGFNFEAIHSPGNSSDEEAFVCSPFSPVQVVSPCSPSCIFGGEAPKEMSKETFDGLFKKPAQMADCPSPATIEEKVDTYDSFYLIGRRNEPQYKPYHSRRPDGTRPKHTWPVFLNSPASPEQPGSQETIPATTSPGPDDGKRNEDSKAEKNLNSVKPDVEVRGPVRPKNKSKSMRKKLEWPDLDTLDVMHMSSTLGEDFPGCADDHVCRSLPSTSDDDSDNNEEEEKENRLMRVKTEGGSVKPMAAGEGEGTSVTGGTWQCDPSVSGYPTDDAMDVDECMAAASTGLNLTTEVLSPPASNERVDQAAVIGAMGMYRPGGPPSVGPPDPQMNSIYPTPPSVLIDQQFSPLMHNGQPPATPAPMNTLGPSGSDNIVVKKEDPGVEEMDTDLYDDPETFVDVPELSKMSNLMRSVHEAPIFNGRPKYALPNRGKFAADVITVARLNVAKRRRPLQLPPDYSKISKHLDKEKAVPTKGENVYESITITLQARQLMLQQQQNQSQPQHGMVGVYGRMPPPRPPQMGGMGGPTGPGGYGGQPVQQLNNFVNNQGMYGTPGVGMPPMNYQHPHQQNMYYRGPGGGPPYPGQGMGPPMDHHQQQQQQHQQQMMNMGGHMGGPPGMGQMAPQGMGQMGGPMMQHGMGHPQMGQMGGMHQMGGPMQSPMLGQHPMQGGMGPGGHMGHPGMPNQPMQQQMNQGQPHYGGIEQQGYGMPSTSAQSPMVQSSPYSQTQMSAGSMSHPASVGQQQQMMRPDSMGGACEGFSLPLSLLLSDTVLDQHYDTVFDACPICSCNTTIRARELGLYITPPDILRKSAAEQAQHIGPWSGFHIDQANTCGCGFSAVRYRYLSMCSGLFPEDSREATGSEFSVARIGENVGHPLSQMTFDPSSRADMNMIDLVRIMSLNRDMADLVLSSSLLAENLDKALKVQTVGTVDNPSGCEYIISNIDSVELLLMYNASCEHFSTTGIRKSAPPALHRDPLLNYFHPWGLQIANEVREPSDCEWQFQLMDLKPVIEDSVRIMRGAQGPGNIVEGPLSWANLSGKCIKNAAGQDEEYSVAEPIPYLIVATEKDAMKISPQALRVWEHLSLGPVDQPKDILYITAVPDSEALQEPVTRYMMELSQGYERLRLGRHIGMNREPCKNGIIRVGTKPLPMTHPNRTLDFLDTVEKFRVIDQDLITRIKAFCTQLEELVSKVLDDDNVFDRRYFREAVALDARAKRAQFAQLQDTNLNKDTINEKLKEEHHKQFLNTHYPQHAESSASAEMGGDPSNQQMGGPSDSIDAVMQDAPMLPDEMQGGNQQCGSGSGQQPQQLGAQQHTEQMMQQQSQQQQQQQQMEHQMQMGQIQMTNAGGSMPQMQQHQNQQQMPPQLHQQQQNESQQLQQQQMMSQMLEPEEIPEDDAYSLPQIIVIYIMNPFCWGELRTGNNARVVTQALLRAFNNICKRLPMRRRTQLQLEIIGLPQVLDFTCQLPDFCRENGLVHRIDRGLGLCERLVNDRIFCQDQLRQTAIAVYSQRRILLPECVKHILPNSMTKFGPASELSDTIEELERSSNIPMYKVPSNPWHLAPNSAMQQKADGKVVVLNSEEQVLYVSYCLLGADWMCVAVTDSLGKISDNCLINLKTRVSGNHIYRYRARTQLLDAMSRLWTYILGTISMETKSWRLVIGRMGRIGHGEFRAWASLLSKTSLRRHTQRMKESCEACAKMPASCPLGGTPAILSACLVSFEPEPNLRIFPSYFTFPEQSGKGQKVRNLHTPDDTSCTHIIVFPTSADIQLSSNDQQGDAHMDDDDFDIGDIDFPTGDDGDGMNEIMKDLCFGGEGEAQNAPLTAGIRAQGHSFFDAPQEVSIENQPLATGYYVSTAPAPQLPDWFWAQCPSSKRSTPVHLKASLHINVPLAQQGDEFLNQKADKEKENEHPLDSTRTDEVLRNVLETYNALSWLNIDPVTGERRSCLPVHMQALLRLYHSVARLIA